MLAVDTEEDGKVCERMHECGGKQLSHVGIQGTSSIHIRKTLSERFVACDIEQDKCEDMNRVSTHKSLSSAEREYEIHKLEFIYTRSYAKLCSQGGNKTIQALKKADLAPEVLMEFFVNHHSLLNRWVILALSISQSILHIIFIRLVSVELRG
ncbi:hypothetical protein L6452_39202 [Arctium lappa]|uniref:Uncharacterized protein n=1 Tax=Arctium lappa TaxID=4217 RepID=A0ACB8XSB0_ARCLA|nr:hypothetical protein L6452_39202 [Arctium lappa]